MLQKFTKCLGGLRRLWGALLAFALLTSAASPAHAVLSAVGAPDPANGFPLWYQDSNNISLTACLDENHLCGVFPVSPNFNAALPVAFPANFPTAFVYWRADTGKSLGADRVQMFVEGTFFTTGGATPVPAAGQQLVTQKVAVIIASPPETGTYTMQYPFGTHTFNCTAGVLCKPVFGFPFPVAPLNFAAALGTPPIGSFGPYLRPSASSGGAPLPLIVDPATGHRYIGDSLTPSFVTGGTNGNSLTILAPSGAVVDTTDQFLITGEVTGSTVTPPANAFKPQQAGVASAPQTFTVTNFDTAAMTLGTIAITGANAADFSITADTCSGATLPAATGTAVSTCTFNVTFNGAAGAAAARSASLSIPTTAPANNASATVALSGTVDNTPPTVVSVTPADGAVQFAINSSITVTFSEPMDPATINASTFTVSGVSGTVSYDAANNVAIFTPSANMPINTTLTATITTGVTDLAGNALSADKTFSFTTGAVTDTAALAVLSTDPVDNSGNVALDSSISASFNKEMDSSTLNTASFSLSPSTTGTVTYDASTASAVFKPAGKLLPNTTYTATLTTDVADISGNHLSSNFSWKFLTESGLNSLDLVSPDDGATGLDSGNVQLVWQVPALKSASTVKYDVFVCENSSFTGCSPTALTAAGTTALATGHHGGGKTAAAGGAGAVLSGLLMAGSIRQRRKLLVLLALAATCGTILISCGGGSKGAPTTVTFSPAGLQKGTLYFWKVTADDGNGSQVESETRSFTTAQ